MLEVSELAIRLWMPMTRPCMSNKGPPESPPTSVHSVKTHLSTGELTRPSRTGGVRPCFQPPGWPMASTHWPFFTSPDLPISQQGYLPSVVILSSPLSAVLFWPSDLPLTALPSGKVMVHSRPGWPDTWPAVSTKPSSEITTPLP